MNAVEAMDPTAATTLKLIHPRENHDRTVGTAQNLSSIVCTRVPDPMKSETIAKAPTGCLRLRMRSGPG
jgi:hypothetical protein